MRRAALPFAALALHACLAVAASAQATRPGPLVTGAWLQERLGDPAVLVLQIDNRRDGYDAGHIPGARFVAANGLPLLGGPGYEPAAADLLVAALEAAGAGDDVHIVLASGTLLTATRAWLTLDYLGHGDHASVLDGGPALWAAQGRPLVTDTPAAVTRSLTARPRPGILADADWIAARLEDPDVAFLDARTATQYSGEDGGMGGQMSAGHLPGAAHLDWESLVAPEAEHRVFLPVDSLRALFEQAGAAPGRTVVSYCVIGTRASLDYFVGRLLGYDMRFYEGSWHEWSARALPFESGRAPAVVETQLPRALVSGEWLQDRLADPAILVLQIDGRRDGYDAGHIPGARFIAQSAIALDEDPGYELPSADSLEAVLEAAGVSDDVHVVITALSPLAATRLWLSLDWLGHGDHASILDGGLARWKAEGRPVVADVPAARPGSLTPRPRPDMLVDAGWIAARLDDAGVALIDARPDAEYTGEDGGMGGTVHPGHIPGAAQLYWEELIVSRQTDPSFLPIDRMRSLFEAAGAGADRTVVTYCMIGARASLTYFVGRMLGYDMRFYDGSWHDWGARDLPHVTGRSRR